MKIECTYDRLVAPGDLTPAKSNPRKHGKEQLRLLEKNIRELGWRYPVVVSKRSGRIVAGHARWEVATRMGLTEIPVDDQDFASDAEELAAIIAGDKLAELAEVDAPMLRDLLGAIDTSDIDLELTGFSECEIAGLTGGPSAEVTEDEAPEPPAVPVTCPGAVWLLGEHRVMCGDSTKPDDVARLMDGKTASLVFADPPYGIDVVGDGGNIGGDTKAAPTTKFRKVIGDDKPFDPTFILSFAPVAFIWGGNYFAHLLPKAGRWFVWDKNRPEGLSLSDCELAWSSIKGVKVQKFKCTWDGYHKEGESGRRVHPNQKPIKLLADVLREVSAEGESLIDPFGGSGSTLIAAEQTNRTCYTMELDPAYCDVICQRWRNLTGKEPVLWQGE